MSAATKEKAKRQAKPERVTLRAALLAVLHGEGATAEDAAAAIVKRGEFVKRNKGALTPGEVAKCARWHEDVFTVAKDGTITKRTPSKAK